MEDAGPGRGCKVVGCCRWRGKVAEVEIVRWRGQGGRNHRITCEERRHPGSVKIYGKTMSLLIGLHILGREVFLLIWPDTISIWKCSC